MLVECGQCGGMTPGEGVFCDVCGAPMGKAVGGAAPLARSDGGSHSHFGPGSGGAGLSRAPKNVVFVQGGPAATPASGSQETEERKAVDGVDSPVRNPVLDVFASAGDSASARPVVSCPLLDIRYDRRQVYVENMPMPLRFLVTPLVPGLCNIRVWVELTGADGQCSVQERPVTWRDPEPNVSREVRLSVHAPHRGCQACMFYFGFSCKGETYIYEADGELLVYPENASAGQVLRDLSLNISNDIRTGHAADVHVRQAADEVERIVDRLRPSSHIVDVLNELRGGTPAYCTLLVYPSSWQPSTRVEPTLRADIAPVALADEPSLAAVRDRLTLRAGGRRLHVLTAGEISIGKHRDNTIVTRRFRGGRADVSDNARISRYHCRVRCGAGHFALIDGGVYAGEGSKSPPWGTFLDGRRLAPMESVPLPRSCSAVLTLASADDLDGTGFALRLEPWNCGAGMRDECALRDGCAGGEVGSLIVRRRDEEQEAFVAVIGCCNLKHADPMFDGMLVWRDAARGAFGWRTRESQGWLCPGTMVRAGDAVIGVEEWAQIGL